MKSILKSRLERFRRLFAAPSLQEEFSFARHTTIGCGGVAALAVSPACTEELCEVLARLHEEDIPYRLLGAGANVLPPEGRFEGVVVRFARLNRLYACGERIFAGAGVTGGALCRFAREHGLGGLEPFTGIPMTAGGACAMNAGVPERHFGDLVEGVLAVDRTAPRFLSQKECRFGEKDSVFLRDGLAVAGVFLRTAYSSFEEIARRSCYFRRRRSALPKGRSMGCVFVNPAGISAGRLIEQCGWKGRAVGGARIACEHANFVLNEGGSAEEVSALIERVREDVLQKTGILLREEIRRF